MSDSADPIARVFERIEKAIKGGKDVLHDDLRALVDHARGLS